MKVFAAALLAGSAAAFAPASVSKSSNSVLHESKADLETLAKDLNPIVGFWDPMGLADSQMWGLSDDRTIGFLRQSEVKHSRIAMFAFVGYCVQSSFTWPWAMTMKGEPFPSTDLSPPEQWDALPLISKLQILAFIGFLEWYSELTPGEGSTGGQVHYTKGGPIGKFPTFDDVPHSVPFNYYDPFQFSVNMSEEDKTRRLKSEINNGRLAMIGILGFLAEQTTPGSVPLLTGIVKPYSGEPMAPFEANWSF